jgi:hypothetical protein
MRKVKKTDLIIVAALTAVLLGNAWAQPAERNAFAIRNVRIFDGFHVIEKGDV